MITPRAYHTATLLADGRVLAAGGWNSVDVFDSAELYDRGLRFNAAWRPVLSGVQGLPLVAGGSGFRGYQLAEASDGGMSSSPTNYPLLQLHRVDNDEVHWLLPDPDHPFSATAFTSVPVDGLPWGPYLATVFVNGIPGVSAFVLVRGHLVYLPAILRQAY